MKVVIQQRMKVVINFNKQVSTLNLLPLMRERERERERGMGCCKDKHNHKSSVWETDSGAAAQNIGGTLHTNVVLRLITVSGAASLVSTAIAVWNCQRQKKTAC
jgi:hypothetical protein